jgi:hypothetical protein
LDGPEDIENPRTDWQNVLTERQLPKDILGTQDLHSSEHYNVKIVFLLKNINHNIWYFQF